jgi:uncharacterized protein YidB (DUF937 family)
MGLLDSLLSGLGGQLGGQAGGSAPAGNPLLQILLQMLANGGAGAAPGGGQGGMAGGGLGALIEQFTRAGYGQQMNSWISTGENLPISPDQLMQIFGQDRLQQMAQGSGMDLDQLSGGLADMLPQFIDRLTPEGQVPASGIDSALSELSRMMPR